MLLIHFLIVGALVLSNSASALNATVVPSYTTGFGHTIIAPIISLVKAHGYVGVLVAMVLESASVPVPSEVVLPLAGVLAHNGYFSILDVLLVIYLGSFIGIAIDYYIGYYLGKDFVLSHLDWFHLKRKTLLSFNRWFATNGAFAVFVCRCLPVVRSIISFPAGFARMEPKKFFVYSMAGAILWDTALTLFGYFELSAASGSRTIIALSIFIIVLYFVYVEIVHKRIGGA